MTSEEVATVLANYNMKVLQYELSLTSCLSDIGKALALNDDLIEELMRFVEDQSAKLNKLGSKAEEDKSELIEKLVDNARLTARVEELTSAPAQREVHNLGSMRTQLESEQGQLLAEMKNMEASFRSTHNEIMRLGPVLRKEEARSFSKGRVFKEMLLKETTKDMTDGFKLVVA